MFKRVLLLAVPSFAPNLNSRKSKTNFKNKEAKTFSI